MTTGGGTEITPILTRARRQSCKALKKIVRQRNACDRPAAEVSDAAAAALSGAPILTPLPGLEACAGQRHCLMRCTQHELSMPHGVNPQRLLATQVQLFQ
jgi:hypothetical protein